MGTSKLKTLLARLANEALGYRKRVRKAVAKRLFVGNREHGLQGVDAETEPVQTVNIETIPRDLQDSPVVYAPPPLTGQSPQLHLYQNAVLLGKSPVAVSDAGRVLTHSIFRTDERTESALQTVSVRDQVRASLGRLARPTHAVHSERLKPLVTLDSRWNSFGHWIPEHLLKLYWIKERAELSDFRYLLEQNPPQWKLQLMRAAGIKDENLVFWDARYSRIESLMLPDYPEPSSEALAWVRALLPPDRGASEKSPTKIYVSRKHQKTRGIANEQEVEAVLKAHGFTTVYPEQHSLSEQVNLFSRASSIVGPQGSAFTNQIFANGPLSVVEFFGASRIHLFNRQIALLLGHSHSYTLDPRRASDVGSTDTSVVVDLGELKEVLG